MFPRKISHYVILKQIGKGGMGEVYLAEDNKLYNRKVALKVIPSEFANDAERLRRHKQESEAVSRLSHPNIIIIHEVGFYKGLNFIASEYIEGITLQDRLDRGDLTLQETLKIALQVTDALSAAHENKIIHRDIKPENIMIRDKDGLVKVVDFGIAKLTGKKGHNNGETGTLIKTATGVIIGTLNFIPPEQFAHEKIDERADVWSFGVCLHEMLTGELPQFCSVDSENVVQELNILALKEFEKNAVYKLTPGCLETLEEKAPGELSNIVQKTLEINPDNRYQNIKEAWQDLNKFSHSLEFAEELELSKDPVLKSVASKKMSITNVHSLLGLLLYL